MKVCPNCNDANSCGDYEGPVCEVCAGAGRVLETKDEKLIESRLRLYIANVALAAVGRKEGDLREAKDALLRAVGNTVLDSHTWRQ